MSKDHGSYEKVPRRPLTSQEATWLRELVLANPQWADGGWQADREALAVVFDFGGAAPFGVKGACFDFSRLIFRPFLLEVRRHGICEVLLP